MDALATLRQSRDADHDAPIWHDKGRTIARLAREAGVRIEYVHVDLRALTVTRRALEGNQP